MHLNKNHTFSRRALAMLLTLTLCFSLVPSAFAAQQNSYHDPAEHWMQASNRTNELDVNSVVTRETFKCGECGKVTSFEVFRVPEYTRNGQTALSRNVKYSDGTMMDGVGKGDCMDGVPGKDAHYTGYHYTKAVCETCGGINTNEPKSDYGYLKNVYWLFDCAAEFTQKLEETVTHEYTDDTYHTVTTKGGTYCAFCYGTNHTVNRTLERHSMETEVLPQPANGRFATVEKCSLCDYASYDYTAAKAVIADYYGVVDGQPHTITVSDLSEAGVRTSIRYGNSAESCTMTSAPNYTEEGQYTVYYEITYTYQNVSMTENGVANVWLRDTQTSEDGKCTCGCDDPNCGCQNKHCNGNCCADKGCGENHHFILLDRTKAGCITLGYKDLSFRYGLWDAAKIFRVDGCSDDSFSYFRSWLIVQGKDVYMAALADPDSLADVEPYADCFFETAGYVGAYAYKKLTGEYAFEHLDYDYLLALENELVKDIHYKEGIEYPRDWKALPAFIPRLCAKYPYQYELQQEGCDWNCDLKEIRNLLAAGRKFDREHRNKKKPQQHKGGDAR